MNEDEIILLHDLKALKKNFNDVIDKLSKDLIRSNKTIERADKRQKREFQQPEINKTFSLKPFCSPY